jgi:hypothetical protein
VILVAEHHDQLLQRWREEDRRGISLCHIDFHDDLRGLLIDPQQGRACAMGALERGEAPADPGNFLAHAVLEGRVERVRWLHDVPGGRAWDSGIVRYSTDLTMRLRGQKVGPNSVPLHFEEQQLTNWDGLQEGELLSVDWDCFASHLLEAGSWRERAARFLDGLGQQIPAQSFLVYSPEYSQPSLQPFLEFAEQLSQRFGQPIEWLSPGLQTGELTPAQVETTLPTDPWMRCVIGLRRIGIY